MYRLLKTAHVLGFALFLGSIFGHIVAGVVGGDVGFSRLPRGAQNDHGGDGGLDLPGPRARHRERPRSRGDDGEAPRLALRTRDARRAGGAALGLRRRSCRAGGLVAATSGDFEAARAAIMREHVFGSLSVAITLAIVALGVYKPALTFIATQRESGGDPGMRDC